MAGVSCVSCVSCVLLLTLLSLHASSSLIHPVEHFVSAGCNRIYQGQGDKINYLRIPSHCPRGTVTWINPMPDEELVLSLKRLGHPLSFCLSGVKPAWGPEPDTYPILLVPEFFPADAPSCVQSLGTDGTQFVAYVLLAPLETVSGTTFSYSVGDFDEENMVRYSEAAAEDALTSDRASSAVPGDIDTIFNSLANEKRGAVWQELHKRVIDKNEKLHVSEHLEVLHENIEKSTAKRNKRLEDSSEDIIIDDMILSPEEYKEVFGDNKQNNLKVNHIRDKKNVLPKMLPRKLPDYDSIHSNDINDRKNILPEKLTRKLPDYDNAHGNYKEKRNTLQRKDDSITDGSPGFVNVDRRNAIRGERYRWPNRTVPYTFGPNLKFTNSDYQQFENAVAEWEKLTCLKFKRVSQSYIGNHIRFITPPENKCASWVGMRGPGAQDILLARGCRKSSIISHEIGHAIGLYHEHQRPDRDEHVDVNSHNIKDGKGHNFKKQDPHGVNTYHVPYDFQSLMHYGAWDFSKNGKKTITTHDDLIDSAIGEYEGLSFYDAMLVNRMYNCSAGCDVRQKCPKGAFQGADCRCYCRRPHSYLVLEPCQVGPAPPCVDRYDYFICELDVACTHYPDMCRKTCNLC